MEELPGARQIVISVSDSTSTASLTLTMNVQIDNNNRPMIMFQGDDTAVFVQGSTLPHCIGKYTEKQ